LLLELPLLVLLFVFAVAIAVAFVLAVASRYPKALALGLKNIPPETEL
jgi:hypothetical protein